MDLDRISSGRHLSFYSRDRFLHMNLNAFFPYKCLPQTTLKQLSSTAFHLVTTSISVVCGVNLTIGEDGLCGVFVALKIPHALVGDIGCIGRFSCFCW